MKGVDGVYRLEYVVIVVALNLLLVYAINMLAIQYPVPLTEFNVEDIGHHLMALIVNVVFMYVIPFIMVLLVAGSTGSFIITGLFVLLEIYSFNQLYAGGSSGYGAPILLSLTIVPPLIAGFMVFLGYYFITGREFRDRELLGSLLNSLKELWRGGGGGGYVVSDTLSNLALMFSIAGVGVYVACVAGVYRSLYMVVYGGGSAVELYNRVLTGILVSMVLSLLISIVSRNTFTVVVAGAMATLPWISLPAYPLLALSTPIQSYRALATRGREVLLGFAEAKLVYDRVSNPYTGFDQEPLLESVRRGRKTWFWKRVDEPLTIDLLGLRNRHIAVFGASGTGKSSLAKNLAVQIYWRYGIPFLIIDHHNEYIDLPEILGEEVNLLEADKASINPLDLEGRSPRERAIELADLIQSIYGLGYIQRNALEELILRTYEEHGIFDDNSSTWTRPAPTFYDVYRVLDSLLESEISDQYRLTLERLRAYLRMLLSNIFMETRISLQKLFEEPTIVLLADLPSDHARALYVDTLLYKIINAMYGLRRGRGLTIVVDEAHLLFRRSRSKVLVSRLLMESRKYGIGMIIISQQPLDLSESVVLNTAIKYVFNIGEYRNLDYIAKSIAGYLHSQKINSLKIAISSLPRHHAITCIENNIYLVDTSRLRLVGLRGISNT